MCGAGVTATGQGVAHRESNSAWLGRVSSAPRATVSTDFGVANCEEDTQVTSQVRGALLERRGPTYGAQSMPLRPPKSGAAIRGLWAGWEERGQGDRGERRTQLEKTRSGLRMVARPPLGRCSGWELLRDRQVALHVVPRGRARPPCPGRHLAASSAAIVQGPAYAS